MFDIYIQAISNRFDFIEFKQKVLFFKQPNHKAIEFANLSLEEFNLIKNFVCDFEKSMLCNQPANLKDFESNLFEVCPSIKTYPSAANLVARILMSKDNYDILFSSNN